ncbi:chemotaxis protein CheW [Gloeothece verrucosa]|uniref:CheW protein n=1 Tax=Gloeothece verrucosa (strain PCC 7822) TaxID=497965 RepID=E0UFM9_GLOV7|nr:chemotaxis protein CheW [Gloeothece verrucosa]ADN13140.1 CheW protein [Gloeothece verrucosa PCC 7822]
MALFTSIYPRRKALYQAEAKKTFISFRLRNCWFALPITSVQKVIVLENIDGDPKGTGLGLTRYQNQEILVIDVGYKIFGEAQQNLEKIADFAEEEQRYLAILSNPTVNIWGLPIDSPPTIQRVSESAFTDIPDAYLAMGNLQCISSKMIQIPDAPAIFLLETELLCENFLSK